MSHKKRSQSVRNPSIQEHDINCQKEDDHNIWLFVSSRIRAPFDAPTDTDRIRVFRETHEMWKDFVYLYDAKKSPEYYAERFDKVLAQQIETAPFDDLEKLNLHWALGVPISKELLYKVKDTHKVECDNQWYVTGYTGMNTFEEWPEDWPNILLDPINDYGDVPEGPGSRIPGYQKSKALERERHAIRTRPRLYTSTSPSSSARRSQSTLPASSNSRSRPSTSSVSRKRDSSSRTPRGRENSRTRKNSRRYSPSPVRAKSAQPAATFKKRPQSARKSSSKRRTSQLSTDGSDDDDTGRLDEMAVKMWQFLNREMRDPVTKQAQPMTVSPGTWQKFMTQENLRKSYQHIHQKYMRKLAPNLHRTSFSLQKKIELYWALHIAVDKEFLKILEQKYDITMDRKGIVLVYSDKIAPVEEVEVESPDRMEGGGESPDEWENNEDTCSEVNEEDDMMLLEQRPKASKPTSSRRKASTLRESSIARRQKTVPQSPIFLGEPTLDGPFHDQSNSSRPPIRPFSSEEELDMWKHVRRVTRAPSIDQLRKVQLNIEFWNAFKNADAWRSRPAQYYMNHFRTNLLHDVANSPFSRNAKIELYFVLDCPVDEAFVQTMERTHICQIDNDGRLAAFSKKSVHDQRVWWPSPELMWEYLLDQCTDLQGNTVTFSIETADLKFWKNLNTAMNLGKNAQHVKHHYETVLLPHVAELDIPINDLLAIHYCFQIPVHESVLKRARENLYCARLSKSNKIIGYKSIKEELVEEDPQDVQMYEISAEGSDMSSISDNFETNTPREAESLPDIDLDIVTDDDAPSTSNNVTVNGGDLMKAFRDAIANVDDKCLDEVLDHIDMHLDNYKLDGKTIDKTTLDRIVRSAIDYSERQV